MTFLISLAQILGLTLLAMLSIVIFFGIPCIVTYIITSLIFKFEVF